MNYTQKLKHLTKKEFPVKLDEKLKVKGISGIRDVDIEILARVADKDLPSICSTNSYLLSLCREESFWRKKLLERYGKILGGEKEIKEKYLGDNSWHEYYIWLIEAVEDEDPYTVSVNAQLNNRDDIIQVLEAKGIIQPTYREKRNGPLIDKGYMRNDPEHEDEPVGRIEKYADMGGNETLLNVETYKNGVLDGEYITYLSGEPHTIMIFKNGQLISTELTEKVKREQEKRVKKERKKSLKERDEYMGHAFY